MALESVTIKDASDLTETIATDEVGGLNYQVLKLAFGPDGTATLVESATGLPVLVMAALPAGNNNIGDVDLASAIPAGNNNIGDVDLASAIPAGNNNIGDVDVASIAAGSNLIGQMDLNSVPASSRGTDSNSMAHATDAIMNNLTSLTPKFAKANIATGTTDGAVVAAVTSKKLRVVSFRLHTGATATTATFTSKPGGAGTAISELFALGANGGRAEGFNPVGHFETTSGEGLSLTTGGGGSTTGVGVVYIEV